MSTERRDLFGRGVRIIGTTLLLVAAMTAAATAEVSLGLALGRERIYPGEAVPVTVTLCISGETVRNIGYPRLAAPDGGPVAFSAPVQDADPTNPTVTLQRFTGQISNNKPGPVTVGPARLDCEVMEAAAGSAAFFGGVEAQPRSLETDAKSLTILPLPAAGRPASFSGAVGNFTMLVSTKPESVSVKEPLTITSTIRGSGNLAHASCPEVKGANLTHYPVQERRSASMLVCEQVVVPVVAGALPALVWSYFDPQQGRYRTVRQTLREAAAAPLQVPAAPTNTVKGNSLPPASPLLHPSPLLILPAGVLVLVGGGAIFWSVRRKYHNPDREEPRSAMPATEPHYLALAEQALAAGDVENYYTVIFNILREVAAPAKEDLSHESALPMAFSRCSVKSVSCDYLLTQCDRVRFGRFVPPNEVMRSDFFLLRSLLQSVNHPHG